MSKAICNAASADGSVVAGDAKHGINLFSASRWTGNAAPTNLGGTIPNGFIGTSGYGSSDDGLTIVGSREEPGFALEACFWTGDQLIGIGTEDT